MLGLDRGGSCRGSAYKLNRDDAIKNIDILFKTGNFEFGINGTSQAIHGFSGTVSLSGGTVSDGSWSHIAWTRTGTTNKLYKNGSDTGASLSDASDISKAGNPVKLGVGNSTTSEVYFDQLVMYKGAALTATQLRQAGFDEETILSLIEDQRPILKQAGFSDVEINKEFGIAPTHSNSLLCLLYTSPSPRDS